MAMRWGLGPVFAFECLRTARRWQVYAARSLFLAALLAALSVVWVAHVVEQPTPTLEGEAHLGEQFFYALVGTQLALVLLGAPAATAGAVSLDKARGALVHLLVTDLSGAEIVLGKLAARLLPVLGLVAGTLPVLALNLLLGGIDPAALAGAFLITTGVALLGCALALVLSVWGRKTHEVLLATYVVWGLLLLPYPAWDLLATSYGVAPGPPRWLARTNPFWLALAPYADPGATGLIDAAAFLGGCAVLAALLAVLAAAHLRAVAIGQLGRPAGVRRRPGHPPDLRLPCLLSPSLDANPVLWREWHYRRLSRGFRLVWAGYALLAVACSGLAVIVDGGPRGDGVFAVFVNGIQVAIGLLLVTVTATTSLTEERARGTLELILATPLSTRAIVWEKWWGAFRAVPPLAVVPVLTAGALAVVRGLPLAELAIFVVQILAYGVAGTSLGLALAVWVRLPARALIAGVVLHALVSVGWFFLVYPLSGWDVELVRGLAEASPFAGPAVLTAWMRGNYGPGYASPALWAVLWAVVYLLAGLILLAAVVRTFDRCLGRLEGWERHPLPPLPPGERSGV
jgi:ABC-type transport system involved in multi-copper enzyme maturation permease subunit